ncbi:MAG: arsenite efflux MFS transporter ArsK [Burkholderiales bacterium]|nr:arsenite efflux MFS transporter ArsK [Burkholderiales bacterium]
MNSNPGSAPAPGAAAAVWLLGLTQVVGYGTLYYSFGILAGDIAADLGWPVSRVFGAFSLTLLAAGFAAPLAGRLVDRHGAATVMTAGSVAAAGAMAALALLPGPAGFIVGLLLVQMATTFVTYDAAFACLVQNTGLAAGRRIVHLTLIAGFASTIFWPLTSWLHGLVEWRTIVLAYAAVNLLVCAPVHHRLRRMRPQVEPQAAGTGDGHAAGAAKAAYAPVPLPEARQRRAMVLVAIAFALGGFVLSAILAQMVPLLSALRLGDAAVAVAMLFGPAQVLVRFVNMQVGQANHPIVPTLISSALLPIAVTVLAFGGSNLLAACVFAVVLGAGSGLKSIVQGTLPLALFGRRAYGERLGRIASVRLVMASVAPFVLALMLETSGAVAALATMAVVGLSGTIAFVAVARMCRPDTSDQR